MFLTAKKVPWSSIVGQIVTLHDQTGRHVAQLALHGLSPPEGMSVKDFADDIADLIVMSFGGDNETSLPA